VIAVVVTCDGIGVRIEEKNATGVGTRIRFVSPVRKHHAVLDPDGLAFGLVRVSSKARGGRKSRNAPRAREVSEKGCSDCPFRFRSGLLATIFLHFIRPTSFLVFILASFLSSNHAALPTSRLLRRGCDDGRRRTGGPSLYRFIDRRDAPGSPRITTLIVPFFSYLSFLRNTTVFRTIFNPTPTWLNDYDITRHVVAVS
jgi:hypothetical protein